MSHPDWDNRKMEVPEDRSTGEFAKRFMDPKPARITTEKTANARNPALPDGWMPDIWALDTDGCPMCGDPADRPCAKPVCYRGLVKTKKDGDLKTINGAEPSKETE